MGYGLEVNVPLLVNSGQHFNLVVEHYRAFNVETGPASGKDLMVYSPVDHSRFGTFLELISSLDRFADKRTVLVVNHGMSDEHDNPLGLILPLTSHAPTWNPEEYTLGLLADFIGQTPSDSDYAQIERNSSTRTRQGLTVRMPAGTLKPLDIALRSLRGKNLLQRLELRACNLGGNSRVMQLLGGVLGVQVIVAPKVHMFYSRLAPPGPLPDDDAGFTRWQRLHPRARVFTEDTLTNPRRVGIQINGRGASRTMDFDTTNIDVKWFVEHFILPNSRYVSRPAGRDARVAPLSFSGMDVAGSFALAQEDDYEAQLVEEFPTSI
jgi:hypothetical protein